MMLHALPPSSCLEPRSGLQDSPNKLKNTGTSFCSSMVQTVSYNMPYDIILQQIYILLYTES